MPKDELLELSYRMARRLKELSQCQGPVVDRLESRLAADEEYLLAAKRIASV